MRKHVSTITTVLVFLTGLSLLLYPTVSNYWNSKHQTQAVAEYSDRIEKMDEQEKKQAFEQAEKYNETLISDPGRFTPTEEQDEWYKSLLDIDGTGMMGYITIPEIDCKLALYHTVDASVLQVGVGHMEGSSLPIGGSGTHCVFSGHRGLPSAKLFTDLDRLQKGDIFLLHIYDQVFTYEVDQIHIVEPIDYGLLNIEEGEDLCTLLTCTPYGINTQRLLVRGHRIANRAGDNSRITSDAAKVSTVLVAVGIGIPLLIISFIAVDVSERVPKRKKKKVKTEVKTEEETQPYKPEQNESEQNKPVGEEDEVPIQAELLQSNKENDMHAGFCRCFFRDADEHTGSGCGESRTDKRKYFSWMSGRGSGVFAVSCGRLQRYRWFCTDRKISELSGFPGIR